MVPAQQEMPDRLGRRQRLHHPISWFRPRCGFPLVHGRYAAAEPHLLSLCCRTFMKLFPSRLHIAAPVLLMLAVVSFSGCAKHQEASTSTPAEAQAAIQQAFSQAKP